MSVETKRIFHISASSVTFLKKQLGVEDSNDPDLGWRMWCGRDDTAGSGNITKWLAKDRPARVTSMVVDSTNITASLVNVEPSGDIRLTAGDQVEFSDQFNTGSTWSQTYTPLSESIAEWDAMEVLGGGEVSIFAMIAAAAASTLTAGRVGYGSATNALTGEAAFNYDSANNYLCVGGTTPECGVDVGGAAPVHVSGSATSIHATGHVECTDAYVKATMYLPAMTAGSIPYVGGSPARLYQDNTYLNYTGPTGVFRAFSSSVGVPTTLDIGATSTYTGVASTVTISASAASAVAQVNIASSQNIDVYALYSLKLRTTGAGDVEIESTQDVKISGDEISVESSKVTNLKNEAWGTPTAAGWSSGTVTANFSTGKDIQKIAVDANVTVLALTAPTGGDAKTMRIVLENETTTHTFGGVGWAPVHWPVAANPVGTPVSAAENDFVIIDLAYIDGDWFGEVDVWEYSGE